MTSACLLLVVQVFLVFFARCPLVGSVRQVLDERIDSTAVSETQATEHLKTNSSSAQASSTEAGGRVLHPVVVVGPLLGQTLEVKDDRWNSVCSTLVSRWRTAWVSLEPMQMNCALDEYMQLKWDPETKTTTGAEKISVRAAEGWAGLKLPFLELYGHLIDRLSKEGYAKDVNIFPQSYDWRLSVHDWRKGVFPEMQKMIERAYKMLQQPIVLTGLSMAGPFTHAFLTWVREQQGPAWAATHIHAWVPVGAPWNGAVNALSSILGGALLSLSTPMKAFDEAKMVCPKCAPALATEGTEGGWSPLRSLMSFLGGAIGSAEFAIEGVLERKLTELLRTIPSIYWMSTGMDESTDPPTDREYVKLIDGEDERVVTASMMPQAFRKIDQARQVESNAAELLEYAMSVGTTADPGVPVHCVYAHNIQTFARLQLPTGSDTQSKATVELDDGDGTVHLAGSLDICDRWPSTVKTYRYEGIPHMFSMAVSQVLDVIAAVATEDTTSWQDWKEPSFDEIELLPYPTSLSKELFRKNLLVQGDHKP